MPAPRGGGVPAPVGVWFWGVPALVGCLLPGGSGPGGGGCLLLGEGVWSQAVPDGDTPPCTATAAGGTHPTGMHSCSS